MRARRIPVRTLGMILAVLVSGCASHTASLHARPSPDISRGRSMPLIDGLGRLIAIPLQLVFWSSKFSNHRISDETEHVVQDYLRTASPQPALTEVKVRLNEYAPVDDLRRLWTNHHVAWPYRFFPGLLTTLIFDVALPGRVFSGIIGDFYNPFTNTVHLFSDHPAIALHEVGHAHDFAERRYKGTYAFIRGVPGMNLFQEYIATDKAVSHFIATGNQEQELAAYKILYPAYGTYLGSYYIPYTGLPGAIPGHIWGRAKARERASYYDLVHEAPSLPEP